jgi:hypothetical protein
MSDKFIKNITRLLETNSNMSLKILLEKEEPNDPFAGFDDEDEGGDDADPGGDPEDEGGDSDEPGDDAEEGGDPDEAGGDEVAGADEDHKTIDVLADLRDNMKRAELSDNDTDRMIKQYQVNSNPVKLVSNKVISYDSIKSFVMLEKEDKGEMQDMINSFQDQIEDMEKDSYSAVKTMTAGAQINVAAEVDNALHQVKYFDKLFKKSEIVHDWFVEEIAKTGPSDKKEEMIKQFKEQFNEKLSSEDKVGIQVEPASYNAMAGAKPTA